VSRQDKIGRGGTKKGRGQGWNGTERGHDRGSWYREREDETGAERGHDRGGEGTERGRGQGRLPRGCAASAHTPELVIFLSPTLDATIGQIDAFLGQLPYKCHLNRVASVGD
jgi:hypothetical protein